MEEVVGWWNHKRARNGVYQFLPSQWPSGWCCCSCFPYDGLNDFEGFIVADYKYCGSEPLASASVTFAC